MKNFQNVYSNLLYETLLTRDEKEINKIIKESIFRMANRMTQDEKKNINICIDEIDALYYRVVDYIRQLYSFMDTLDKRRLELMQLRDKK